MFQVNNVIPAVSQFPVIGDNVVLGKLHKQRQVVHQFRNIKSFDLENKSLMDCNGYKWVLEGFFLIETLKIDIIYTLNFSPK